MHNCFKRKDNTLNVPNVTNIVGFFSLININPVQKSCTLLNIVVDEVNKGS